MANYFNNNGQFNHGITDLLQWQHIRETTRDWLSCRNCQASLKRYALTVRTSKKFSENVMFYEFFEAFINYSGFSGGF